MKAAEPAAVVGRLSVVTNPPGARIAIDGKPRGVSPLIVAESHAGGAQGHGDRRRGRG